LEAAASQNTNCTTVTTTTTTTATAQQLPEKPYHFIHQPQPKLKTRATKSTKIDAATACYSGRKTAAA
jgi:hypothetical protein